jgi:HK97 family phage prohead protease
MAAVAVHHTGTSDASWDAGAQTKNIPSDATAAVLGDVFAWKPTGEDADSKSNWKFPHHFVDADGKPGDASTVACSAVVASLNGGRGGADIPDGDRRGVYNHVIAHLKDSGVKEGDLPELKAAPRHPGRELRTATPLALLREHRAGMRGGHERRHRRAAAFEFRAKPDGTGGTSYSFDGYAATFEQPFEMWDMWGDPYFEVLGAGACNRTLSNGADVQFLIGHDESSIPLARTKSGTMRLYSDEHGLGVSVPSLDGRSPIVQALASAMERGDMDEMSIGFIATQQQWSPDWMQRRITEINLNRGDVSVVCWAANPNAAGASMAALPVTEAAARRAGAGRERRTPTAPYTIHPGEDNECPQCHSQNDRDAAYCDQCGNAIRSSGASVVEEDETQRCPCGNWNASDAKFCDQCGTNIASDLDADNGGTGNGATTAPSGYWDWSRPEHRSGPGAEPDFSTKPPQNVAGHGDASLVCPNGECAAPNAKDAGYCDQCGTCLYDEGGLITSGGSVDDVVTDSSGLIEEEDMTLSRQRRLRLLELRAR